MKINAACYHRREMYREPGSVMSYQNKHPLFVLLFLTSTPFGYHKQHFIPARWRMETLLQPCKGMWANIASTTTRLSVQTWLQSWKVEHANIASTMQRYVSKHHFNHYQVKCANIASTTKGWACKHCSNHAKLKSKHHFNHARWM